MRLRSPVFALLIAGASALASLSHAQQSTSADASAAQARDVEAVRAAVMKSAEAYNANDPDAVMALYARDVVLSYPGLPDMGYETLARGYAEMRSRKPGSARTEPTIEEILVSGDLAVVRMIWNTTVTDDAGARNSRQMKDLLVWRREPDGSWKFARGMHFRIPLPSAATAGQP
jgi:uncharacterized protein (TIGR02246 family)